MYSGMTLWVIALATGCSFRHGVAPADGDVVADDGPAMPDAPGCSAVDVQAGADHTCAITRDGSVYCWGRGDDGQLGIDPVPHRCAGNVRCLRTPTKLALSGVRAVGLGTTTTCAATGMQGYCWGKNSTGQYGTGSTIGVTTPASVPARAQAVALDGGTGHLCSLADGAVSCAGANDQGQVGNLSVVQQSTAVAVKTDATTLSLGAATSCAIDTARQLYCWGRNASRTIDPNTTTIKTAPTHVAGIAAVDDVAVGDDHICAVSGGALQCWGLNTSGQIGNGQVNNQNQPQPITTIALADVVEVSAGRNHTCARTGGGDVYCFGESYTATPTRVAVGASKLASGGDHDCAIIDGTVQCWGKQLYGQLGNSVASVDRATTPQLARICP